MNYRHCEARDFSDYACGGVLRGGAGMPNFPVRLALELYGRGAEHLPEGEPVCLYDPCCGSGYLLTVVGLLAARRPEQVCGSDINPEAVRLARENLSLLTARGRETRGRQIEEKQRAFGRDSYARALRSLARIGEACAGREIAAETLVHDILSPEPPALPMRPNLVLTDVPYGSLVSWQGEGAALGDALLERLAPLLAPGAVAVVCMDKRQHLNSAGYTRLEKEKIGKRRFEIYRRI